MSGGAHFGFGKGVGGLLGGVLKDQLQSMALAFRFRFVKLINQSLFFNSNIYLERSALELLRLLQFSDFIFTALAQSLK